MESGATGNCQVGDYMTHPAFLSIPSTGYWVGKFETGYSGASTNGKARVNEIASSKVIIKPNVYSWRGIQVANAFYTSYDYKRDLDSHMMKNTEWGAVAYLQHSVYGSATSVRINNNSNHLTGYSSISEPTCGSFGFNGDNCGAEILDYCGPSDASDLLCNIYQSTLPSENGTYTINYFNSSSNVASTTGNITGIYDMSGGSWEYMMAVVLDENGNPMSGYDSNENSGFKGIYRMSGKNTTGYDWPDTKYYDRYMYGTSNQEYQRRILGDATGEGGSFESFDYVFETSTNKVTESSWYHNMSVMSYNSWPFFLRGGGNYEGFNAGIFNFSSQNGNSCWDRTFRIILTP